MKNKANMLLMCIDGITHEHRVALKTYETPRNSLKLCHMDAHGNLANANLANMLILNHFFKEHVIS